MGPNVGRRCFLAGIFGVLILFAIVSSVIRALKSDGPRGQQSFNFLKGVGFCALIFSGMLPLALLVWVLMKAVNRGNEDLRNRENRNQYSNMNGYRNMSGQKNGQSPMSGSSPYGSSINNYRTGGMNPSVPNNYATNRGTAYYTGYMTKPAAGTNAPSYQDQARNMTNAYRNAINYSGIYNNQKPNSYGLPSSAKKRTKIVKKFSERYDLFLSDREIKRIVDASYLSSGWAREICYMNQKYDTVYEWYASMNPWLKVYLYAFQQQEISSDFALQERIVYDAFNTVFSDACSDASKTIDQAIRHINEKYLTNFDETTFMLAYRYMESKGKKYTFAFNQVLNTQEDIDELLSKYDQSGQGTQTPMQ